MPLCPPLNPPVVTDPAPPPPPPPPPSTMEAFIISSTQPPLTPSSLAGTVTPSQGQPPQSTVSLTNPLPVPSPFDRLDLSQIMTPAPSYQAAVAQAPMDPTTMTPATQYQPGVSGTIPPMLFNNVPPAASYTPANQPIPLSTPMAPRQDRPNPQQ